MNVAHLTMTARSNDVLAQMKKYSKEGGCKWIWGPRIFLLSATIAYVSQFHPSVEAFHNGTHLDGDDQAAVHQTNFSETEKVEADFLFSLLATSELSEDTSVYAENFQSLADQAATLRKGVQHNYYTENVTRSLLGGHAQAKRWPDHRQKKGATIGIVNAMDMVYQPYFDKAVHAWEDANRLHKRDAVHFERSSDRKQNDCDYGIKHKVIMCNGDYGATRWVGLEITISVGNEILKSRIKMNDNYLLDKGRRNMKQESSQHHRHLGKVLNPSYMQYCVCHEMGHALGLAHQDENFSNDPTGSCLDYTRDISNSQQPNEIDYDELARMYGVFDNLAGFGTGAVAAAAASDPAVNGVASVVVPAPSASPTASPTAAPTGPPCCSFDQKICGRDAATFTMQPMCDVSQHHCENVCYGFWQTATERRMIETLTPNCIATYAQCGMNPGAPVCCGNAECSSLHKWCEPVVAGDLLLVDHTTESTKPSDQYERQRHRTPKSRLLADDGLSQKVNLVGDTNFPQGNFERLEFTSRSQGSGRGRVLLSDRLDLNAIEKDINYSSQRYGTLIGEGENTLHFAKQIRRSSRSNVNDGEPLMKYVDIHFLLIPPSVAEDEE